MSVRITEHVAAPQKRVVESAKSFGLEPSRYCGVVWSDLGRGGLINENDRIYPLADFIRENTALAERIDAGEYVASEAGHPKDEPTFNIPARLVKVDLHEQTDGSVLARGAYGFLNTQPGRDMKLLWEDGLPLGSSSVVRGLLEEHVVVKEDEFATLNPSFVGKSINVVRDFVYEGYDLVRVPSASTFADSPTRESHAAYQRLCEAGIQGFEKEEKKRMTLEELQKILSENPKLAESVLKEAADKAVIGAEKAHGKVVKDAVSEALEAAKKSDPLSKLDPKVREHLAAALAGQDDEPDFVKLSKQLEAQGKQGGIDRDRLTLLEADNKKLREVHEALQVELAQARANKAIDKLAEGSPFAELIHNRLREDVEAGRVKVEDIKEEAERLKLMLESAQRVQAPTGEAHTAAADGDDDVVKEGADGKPAPVPVPQAQAPGLLSEGFMKGAKQAIERARELNG